MSAAKPGAPVARGVIHDLGYKRYAGGRLPQSTRWRVVMRNQLSHAWKTWWRYKAWIGFSLLITVVIAAVMYAAQTEDIRELTRHGAVARRIDQLSLGSIEYFTKVGFLLTLTCGAGIIATDLRSGAFTFYFSRPVRPIDYLLGKLSGLVFLHMMIIVVPMLVLMFVRLGLARDTDELLANLQLVPKVALIGTLASVAFASMSLAASSLFGKPAASIGLWAAYYLILTTIVMGVALNSNAAWLATFDFGFALQMMSIQMFDFGITNMPEGVELPSLTACVLGVTGNIVLGITVAYLRIRSVAFAGIGGA